jgi:hypothetical protein
MLAAIKDLELRGVTEAILAAQMATIKMIRRLAAADTIWASVTRLFFTQNLIDQSAESIWLMNLVSLGAINIRMVLAV